ncbi:MAG: DUF3494 domain-containing protein [Eubacteriaceae bacterium]|nr:DUF3494 domain-containing protein [Eubacteriaceae bacterium]
MRIQNKKRLIPLSLTVLMLIFMIMPTTALASGPTKVELRTTSNFAVLSGMTITNAGPTVISGDAGGDIGLHSGTSITGFPPGVISGVVHDTDAVALQAKADLTLAYDDAAGRTPTTTFVETDNQLGGKTLTTGVYRFGGAETANLTASSPLILDAQGDPEAVFIFQATSSLVTASGSQIQLINGARFCRVFWQVGTDVTLGTNSQFVGHIFALNSIWAQTGATIQGQLLARNGEVTLDTNTITNGLCATLATLTVIKHVINDDGRTSIASNFTVHVKTDGLDVAGSPVAGAESPGITYTLSPGTYVVSEDADAHYTVSYSGDSDSSGSVTLVGGDNKTVTITNNDIVAATGSATITNNDIGAATGNDIRANPKTGAKTESGSASWIGISAAVLGGALLFGIFLCLLYQRKGASQR